MSAQTKTDNNPKALQAKIDLRRRVLEHVKPARVFEGFCGPRGEMSPVYESTATVEHHVGCDVRFDFPDRRRRYVGDCHRVMRAIDLSQFNVFDLDAYGSPWEAAIILAARRRWAPGELGAVLLTDGSGRLSQFGQLPKAMAQLVGQKWVAPTNDIAAIHGSCLNAWLEKAGLVAVKRWQAVKLGSGGMVYSATVFTPRVAMKAEPPVEAPPPDKSAGRRRARA